MLRCQPMAKDEADPRALQRALERFAELANRSLDQVVGDNVRRVRLETNRTQDAIATRCRQYGLPWTQSSISEIEAGQRPLEYGELLVLAIVGLGIPPAELLAGDDGPVLVAGSLRLDLAQVRDIAVTRRKASVSGDFDADPQVERSLTQQEAERKAARRLGVAPEAVVAAAVRLWGQSLTAERDARLGPDANHAAKGHITRQLVSQIEAEISMPAKPARTRKGQR